MTNDNLSFSLIYEYKRNSSNVVYTEKKKEKKKNFLPNTFPKVQRIKDVFQYTEEKYIPYMLYVILRF